METLTSLSAINATSAIMLALDMAKSNESRTTASLSRQDVGQRQIVFGSIIAASSGLLLIAGVIVFLVRSRKRQETDSGLAYKPLPVTTKTMRTSTTVQHVGTGMGEVTEDEVETNGDELNDSQLEAEWVLRHSESNRAKHANYLQKRWWILMFIFVVYAATTVGLPVLYAYQATCSRGFFWEVHMQFLAVFVVTKTVELCLCLNDPTLEFGEMPVLIFLWKFLSSFLGYVDSYTDATGVVIAHACPEPIAQTLSILMLADFAVGVVCLQWIYMLGVAARDPSQACFLKLLHMDLLAHMITLPAEQKPVWDRIAFFRTFAEDIPQALLQTLYVVYVKKSPVMLASILVAIGSSVKSLRDARARALATELAKKEFEKRERSTEIYSCSQDGSIRCWDLHTGDCKMVMRDGSPVNEIVAIHGKLYSSHDDKWAREWSLGTGAITRRFACHSSEEVTNGNICGNASFIYTWVESSGGQPFQEWSLVTGDCTRAFGANEKLFTMCVGGDKLYTNGTDACDVSEWSLKPLNETPQCLRSFKGHTEVVTALHVTKKRMFSGARDFTVREWCLETGESTRTFPDHGGLGFFPCSHIFINGSFLYCPSHEEPVVKVWDLQQGKLQQTLRGHSDTITSLAMLEDKLYTGSVDHSIIEWDLQTGTATRTFKGHEGEIFVLVGQLREAE